MTIYRQLQETGSTGQVYDFHCNLIGVAFPSLPEAEFVVGQSGVQCRRFRKRGGIPFGTETNKR
jgi:hypothetical protein